MSYTALAWAATAQCPDPTSKLVLFVLASFLNRKTGQLDPSFDTIAKRAQLTRRAVIQKLALLESAGLVERIVRNAEPGASQNTSNHYRLKVGVVNEVHHRGECHSPGVVNEVHPNQEPRTYPLPPRWEPNDVALREMKERYPELDLNVSTGRFTSYFTSTGSRFTDDGWIQRWTKWITEDGDDLKRPKRTASRLARTEQTKRDNRRRADETLAYIAALQNNVAK